MKTASDTQTPHQPRPARDAPRALERRRSAGRGV